MKYYYEKPKAYVVTKGITYHCDHPVYSVCTLYKLGKHGLAVIQQRFDSRRKTSKWTDIDPWLIDAIYNNQGFCEYFLEHAKTSTDGLYPTVSVRQIMWALRMKPLKRERWETLFDRKEV